LKGYHPVLCGLTIQRYKNDADAIKRNPKKRKASKIASNFLFSIILFSMQLMIVAINSFTINELNKIYTYKKACQLKNILTFENINL
jgi:magnesium-transporting ATPase (P-type)